MSRQQSYSGPSYDRYVERNEQSTIHRLKESYWTTKQAVIKKLGKKEDEHVVASDSELDSKIEVFRAIQKSCMDLLRVIEKYQDRLCALSQEENAMGRFLKSQSDQDKTRAGKMMAAVGKSQSFSSQQRLALRVPLVRLYQEVETFRYRAISDTLLTINRMEGARTEYRGALLWMKDVSEELDPDTFKQLEKFRKVQAQVKKTKARFDKLKLDTMQKIDLLAASRCNMFSHVLANYQSTLLHFWEKTARTMSAVAESFKGYQYYEFNMLKELAEPAKKLAQETSSKREIAEKDTDDLEKDEKDRLISFGEECGLEDDGKDGDRKKDANVGSMSNLFEDKERDGKSAEKTIESPKKSAPGRGDPDPFIDFGLEDEELLDDEDFSGHILPLSKMDKKEKEKSQVPADLLSDDLEREADELEKDDMALLNEILNAPSTGGDDFTREWQAVFGATPLSGTNANYTPVETDKPPESNEFMPSHLLDLSSHMGVMNLNQPGGGVLQNQQGSNGGGQQRASKQHNQQTKGKAQQDKKGEKKDMSAWFSLFADLDPLANPDAIGKQGEEMIGGAL